MSPSRRHGTLTPSAFFHVPPIRLSSNVRNVSPDGALRENARYRNVLPDGWSTADHASRMLSLPGVTPPAFVLNVQCAGSPSFVPPANCVSCSLGSWLRTTRPASSPAQSMNPWPFAWSPSAPWKLLPGSGIGDGVSAADASDPAPHATTPATTHTSGNLGNAIYAIVGYEPHPRLIPIG